MSSVRQESAPAYWLDQELAKTRKRQEKGQNRMKTLQSALDSAIQDILSDDAYDGSEEGIISAMKKKMPDLVKDTARSMLSEIKSEMDAGLNEEREYRQQFEKRLQKHWQKPLTLLELFIALALEAGGDFNGSFRENAVRSKDYRFEALTRMHARACQTASAILVLLRSGFADDAHARWRTLHEIAVVSMFIGDSSQDVAERYLLHERVQQYKSALQYRRHTKALGLDPIPQAEIDQLEIQRNLLVDKYGKPFKGDYGWSASSLGKDRPTFADIEDSVDLEHWRPYYRMASDNTHANSHGAKFRLGLSDHQIDKVLLAGASNAGLADPGHSTAISLQQITLALLMTNTNFDTAVTMHILEELQDEIGDAFLQAHRALEVISNDGKIQKTQGV